MPDLQVGGSARGGRAGGSSASSGDVELAGLGEDASPRVLGGGERDGVDGPVVADREAAGGSRDDDTAGAGLDAGFENLRLLLGLFRKLALSCEGVRLLEGDIQDQCTQARSRWGQS